MKAITYSSYGGPEVLQLQNIAKPLPKDSEILIKVYATSVTAGDVRMRRFNVPTSQWVFARLYLGLLKPRRPVLGLELSGKVEAIGKKVTK
jgi:NADPH:quinone reductase-like Zn-dependent oxidoreductase